MTGLIDRYKVGSYLSVKRLLDCVASENGKRFDPDRDIDQEIPISSLSGKPGRKPLSARGQEMEEAYKRAEEKFFEAAFAGDVVVKGFRGGDERGDFVEVPSVRFQRARIIGTPFTSDEMMFACITNDAVPYVSLGCDIDPDDDDRIMIGREVLFSNLLVGIESARAILGIPPEKGINEMKRAATDKAIQDIGPETLAALPQKERDLLVVERVKQETDRSVSERYARERWKLRKESQVRERS